MDEPKLVDELKKMEYEPLLPIEKKLIGWSLVLGTSLAVYPAAALPGYRQREA